jgi:hypothetical protein
MEAGLPKKKDRVPHFSNPDVKYHDHSTGTKANSSTGEVDKDNSKQLREKACEVAGYRVSNDLSVQIVGISHVCLPKTFEPAEFVASVTGGGPGNYTYAWEIASNGISYGPVISNSDILILNLAGMQIGDRLYIRVKVTTSAGFEQYAYFMVEIIPDDGTCLERGAPSQNDVEKGLSFQTKPNPADESLTVLITPEESVSITVELLGSFGYVFRKTLQKVETKETYEIPIETADLSSGVYLLRVTSGTKVETQKVIIVH